MMYVKHVTKSSGSTKNKLGKRIWRDTMTCIEYDSKKYSDDIAVTE